MFRRSSYHKVLTRPSGASRTEKHWQTYQDIANIIGRVMRGDSSALRNGGVHADVSGVPDSLQDALNQQIDAGLAYDALPDSVKAEYPTAEAFYAAVHDESQKDKLLSLGVLLPQDDAPVKVQITNPSTDVNPVGAKVS